jgi:hypothetical protein
MTALLSFSLLSTPLQRSFADGTETLGPASIPIASGSGVVAAGVGLALGQPGNINLSVPAGATIKQVLIYWEGESFVSTPADDTIEVNGNSVAGTLIGGPTIIFGKENPPGSGIFENVYTATHRADITSGNFVTAGANIISIGGLANDVANNGAGIVVIYDNGDGGLIDLRDGNDFAWDAFLPTEKGKTVAQTFSFASSTNTRTANLAMFFSTVEGTLSGLGMRPTRIEVSVNGSVVTNLLNTLDSNDGQEWDTLNLMVTLLPGDTNLTIHPFSDNLHAPTNAAASFVWSAAVLAIANPTNPPPPTNNVCPHTQGYWKNHPAAWAVTNLVIGGFNYNQAALLKTLKTAPKKGNAAIILAHQLISTLLSYASGSDSGIPQVNQAIADAQTLLTGLALPKANVKSSTPTGQAMVAAAKILDDYNNGKLTPLCSTPPPGGDCYTSGKPNRLNLTLTGNNCASSANSQLAVSGKTSCFEFNGGLTGGSPVHVIATSSSTAPTASTARYFDGNVALGAPFTVLSGSSTFGSNTYFYLYEGGVLKMRIQIHTSCSAPLVNGESFGAIRLDSYSN